MKMEALGDVDPIAVMQEAQLGVDLDIEEMRTDPARNEAGGTPFNCEATHDPEEVTELATSIKKQMTASGSVEPKEAPRVSWRKGGPFLFGNMKPYDGPHDLPTTALVRALFPEWSKRTDEWGHRMIDKIFSYFESRKK